MTPVSTERSVQLLGMLADTILQPKSQRLRRAAQHWLRPITASLAYYAGAQAAFLIGTLSDRIFAPFWPPNAIMFCALLLTPRNRWWAIIAASYPAHVLAELQVGMGAIQLNWAFATNCALALLNAISVRWLCEGPPWFGSIRKVGVYILASAAINPAIVAIGGAFVPILGGATLADYPYYWSTWFVGNALACLTLGPIILTWLDQAPTKQPSGRRGWLEAVITVLVVLFAWMICLELSSRAEGTPFMPAILYLPLPVLLWSAVRYGERGAAGAILALTAASIWLTLNGHSPFLADTPEKNVLALQLFLFGVAVPVLLLSAAVDQLRTAADLTRRLAGSLLIAQDDERRRIARELHDATAQNLVAASLLLKGVEAPEQPQNGANLQAAADLVQQSIDELRVLSYVLHPPELEIGGLTAAARSYARGFSERSGINTTLTVGPEVGDLPRFAELALYRVLQEALSNVDRHSRSSVADVRLSIGRENGKRSIQLTVTDRGRGMSPSENASEEGFHRSGVGLESMSQRLRQIGGTLRIRSAPGETVIRAVVPLTE